MTMNGFGADDATAAYFNASDLGFGRRMHFKRLGSDVAFYVSNHDTVEHATTGVSPIATVAMDYALDPAHAGLGRYTKFYVFDASGNRVNRANLDGNGDKFVPNLCAICHGGNHFSTGASSNATTGFNFNAKFIPFDMDSYTWSTAAAFKPSAQHNAFRTMNIGIRDYTSPTTAILALLNGWYGVAGTGTFNRDFVPTAWQGALDLPVYRDAVKVSCRACHTTRGYDFTSPATVGGCGYNVCTSLVMPDAQRTFSIFWGSKTANTGGTGTPPNQPSMLNARYGGSYIGPCP
jgi:mono/diheme cytochrome c family protein